MHDVFISYTERDKPAADAVCHALEACGIRCWIAPRDVVAGTDWSVAIVAAIRTCKLLVVVLSGRSIESEHVQREVILAVTRGRPVVPFRIENIAVSGVLELQLAKYHWLDAFPPPLDPHLARLCEATKQVLGSFGLSATPPTGKKQSPRDSHRDMPGSIATFGSKRTFTTERVAIWAVGILIAGMIAWTLSYRLLKPNAIERLHAEDSEPSTLKEVQPSPSETSRQTTAAKASRLARVGVKVGVGDLLHDCEDCPELVILPKGTYTMGAGLRSHLGAQYVAAAGPIHNVSIEYTIAVARFEVTRAQFDRFVEATAYVSEAERGLGCLASTESGVQWRADRNWRKPGFSQGDSDPVVCVSWNDTQAYLSWLNTKATGKNFRLLSEAEWEYAARGGAGDSPYYWGDDMSWTDICSYANSVDRKARNEVPRMIALTGADCNDGFAFTAPADLSVSQTHYFKPNKFGLFHMNGNVWEWVQDPWHADYSGAPADGSVWTAGGDASLRIFRGGSWNNHPVYLESGYRANNQASYRDEALGFRVGRSL